MTRDNPTRAQHRIAEAIGVILETWVDPCCVHLFPARGYWAHNHQDVQRWTGYVEVEGVKQSIGSWDLTVSQINSGYRFHVVDDRRARRADNDFQIWAGASS